MFSHSLHKSRLEVYIMDMASGAAAPNSHEAFMLHKHKNLPRHELGTEGLLSDPPTR